ncbi:MAG: sialidase family protein [Eubacteriales bacterium]|jgi:hypothetical protein
MLCIEREHDRILMTDPEVYVDNRARGRSGHMTHAMTEFAPGKFINFNANCSAVRASGHSVYGWVEYRIAEDYGRTWSQVYTLPYSKKAFLDGVYTISVEKAVTCRDGSILAFCLRNTMLEPVCCEPWLTPMAVRSRDGGMTWDEPFEVSPYPGRIYDAVTVDGRIFFLEPKNEHFIGTKPEHTYAVFTSDDDGRSFCELAELPIDGIGRGYGSLLWDGRVLHAYAYNVNRERYMDHAVSEDLGRTWRNAAPCYLNRGIRNPQTALIDGVYILHGRGEGGRGFVFYASDDGDTWSDAFLGGEKCGGCYYSNNLLLNENGKNALLIQYSELWDVPEPGACVNAMHRWLTIEKK